MLTPSPGDLIDSKYRLEGLLARGGMGEVWTARNLRLDVPVAIKLMNAQAVASAELVHRFEREAKAAAQLRHPNVVTIFEYGVFDDVPFMAMELLDGQDLAARLKQRGRLSHAEALPIVIGVCKALRRAHEMHVVHRDLKPANVFLARQDDEEIVKVLDFGIAKIVGGEAGVEPTRAGALLGTPHYMAPEQARDVGIPIDHRADLWALGVIAFRMLTGKLPFPGADPVQVLIRICTERPPIASSIAVDLEPDVDAFFARALARAPADRFQSARDFADAFAALGGLLRVDLPAQSRSSVPPPESRSSAPPPDAELAPLGLVSVVSDNRMSHPGEAPGGPRSVDGGRLQFFRRSSFPPAAPESSAPRSSPPSSAPRSSPPSSAPRSSPPSSAPRSSPPASSALLPEPLPLAPARSPAVDDVLDSAKTLPLLSSARAQPAQDHAVQSADVRPGSGTIPMIVGGTTLPMVHAGPPPSAASPPVPRGAALAGDLAGAPSRSATDEAGIVTPASSGSRPAPPLATGRKTVLVLFVLFAALLAMGLVGWMVAKPRATENPSDQDPYGKPEP